MAMYFDLQTDNRDFLMKLLTEWSESAEPVQVTMNKRGDLYRLELVQKIEPTS
jgi:hypothetical protein